MLTPILAVKSNRENKVTEDNVYGVTIVPILGLGIHP